MHNFVGHVAEVGRREKKVMVEESGITNREINSSRSSSSSSSSRVKN
jgi:hypothetical protein